MATVGQQLTAAETGWKRFDDADQHISYVGNNWTTLSKTSYYNSTRHSASPCLNQTIH